MNCTKKNAAILVCATLVLASTGASNRATATSQSAKATCTGVSSCTVVIHNSTLSSYSRQLSCYWTQPRGSTQKAVRVLIRHMSSNNQPPPMWTLAYPVDAQSAASKAFNVTIQTNNIVQGKDFNITVTFEWDEALTTTLDCSYFFSP